MGEVHVVDHDFLGHLENARRKIHCADEPGSVQKAIFHQFPENEACQPSFKGQIHLE
jgi:hypothetical protein